jgi:hypothetical protein
VARRVNVAVKVAFTVNQQYYFNSEGNQFEHWSQNSLKNNALPIKYRLMYLDSTSNRTSPAVGTHVLPQLYPARQRHNLNSLTDIQNSPEPFIQAAVRNLLKHSNQASHKAQFNAKNKTLAQYAADPLMILFNTTPCMHPSQSCQHAQAW